MTQKETKTLAYAVGSCLTLTTKQKMDLATDVANAFMWSGPRRKDFLTYIERYSGLTGIRENIQKESTS